MLPLVGIVGRAGSGKSEVGKILQEEFGVVPIALADPLKLLARTAFPEISERQLFGPSATREERVEELEARFDTRNAVSDTTIRLLRNFAETQFGASSDTAYTVSRRLLSLLNNKISEGAVPNARIVLQLLGTEWGREIDPNGWTKAALDTASQLLTGGTDYDQATKQLTAQKDPRPCPGVSITDARFPQEAMAILSAGGFLVRVTRGEADAKVSGHVSETAMASLGDWAYSCVIHNDGDLTELRAMVRAMWLRSDQARFRHEFYHDHLWNLDGFKEQLDLINARVAQPKESQ